MAKKVVGNVSVVVNANATAFQKGMKQAKGSLDKFKSQVKTVSIAAAKSIAAIGVATGGFAVKAALDFDKAVASIRKGTGAVGAQLESMSQSVRNVFQEIPVSMEQASVAIGDLNTRLGLSGKALDEAAVAVLKLAKVLDTDVASAARTVSGAIKSFSLDATEAARVSDLLFKAVQSSGVSFSEFDMRMRQAGPTLRELGFGIESTIAFLAQLEKQGFDSSRVMAALSTTAAKLATAYGTTAAEGLQKASAELQNITDHQERYTRAIELFGPTYAAAFLDMIDKGLFNIDALTQGLLANTDSLSAAEEQSRTYADKLQLITNTLKDSLIPIGLEFLNFIEDNIDGLKRLASGVQVVVDLFLDLVDVVTTVVGKLAEVGDSIGGFLFDLGEKASSMADQAYNDLFGEQVNEDIKTFTKNVDNASKAVSDIPPITFNVGSQNLDKANESVNVFTRSVEDLNATIQSSEDSEPSIIPSIPAEVTDSYVATGDVLEQTSTIGQRAFQVLQDGFSNMARGTMDTASMLERTFVDLANTILNEALRSNQAVWGGSSGGGGGGGGFSLGGVVGSVAGGLFGGIGDFFGGFFADGGRPPMGKVSVVGEEGPELFVPDSAGTIIPNSGLTSGGNSGNITIVQNISIHPDIPATTERVIMQKLPMIKEAAIQGVEQKVLKGGQYARNIRG